MSYSMAQRGRNHLTSRSTNSSVSADALKLPRRNNPAPMVSFGEQARENVLQTCATFKRQRACQ